MEHVIVHARELNVTDRMYARRGVCELAGHAAHPSIYRGFQRHCMAHASMFCSNHACVGMPREAVPE